MTDHVCVISANVGGMDAQLFAPAPQTVWAEWLHFTDDETVEPVEPWHIVTMRDVPADADPRRVAKVPKMTPWTCVEGARYYVWLDSNMEVTSPTFLADALAALDGAPLATWRHPRRVTVYAEAEASLSEQPVKYEPMREQIEAQVAFYREQRFPGRPLYACGTLVWDTHHPHATVLGSTWLAQCEHFSAQDQLSLPFVAWQMQAHIATFPEPQVRRRMGRDGYVANNWLRIHAHRRAD